MSKVMYLSVLLILCMLSFTGCVNSDTIYNLKEDKIEVYKDSDVEYIEETDFDREVKVPVLMYHDISEVDYTGADSVNIRLKDFELHINGLIESGYNPISIMDYCKFINCEKDLPEKPIIITFDDGYISNYKLAFPVLRRLNVPATIFIVTSTVGEEVSGGKVNTPHFTWDQALEMEKSGLIEIHSHSHTHSKMAELSIEDLKYEMETSKELIQNKLGKEEVIFAYPYGNYNDLTLNTGEDIGFVLQVLVEDTESGVKDMAVNSKNGLTHFARISVDGDWTLEELLEKIDGAISNSKIFIE